MNGRREQIDTGWISSRCPLPPEDVVPRAPTPSTPPMLLLPHAMSNKKQFPSDDKGEGVGSSHIHRAAKSVFKLLDSIRYISVGSELPIKPRCSRLDSKSTNQSRLLMVTRQQDYLDLDRELQYCCRHKAVETAKTTQDAINWGI